MASGKYEYWLSSDGLTLLEGWAREGLTDEQIAHNAGIAVKTLYEWKKKHLPISKALKKGKQVVDIEVENALLKRALGYDYLEERTEKSKKDGTKIIQTLKHIPADVTAQIFWLRNRRPDRWRNNPENQNDVADVREDDALSRSLKELAGELESDDADV